MVINLSSIDTTQFNVVPHLLCGETVYLVTPQRMGVNWTKENSIFRSSVWNSNGELISGGYKKFVNWGEKPEVFPLPYSLHGCTIVEKLDGSLFIVSKYKGQFIIRTRGTVDASKLDNGHEVELFKQKHALVLNHDMADTWDHSVLFEWLSPINKIVLSYGDEPMWKLVGFVDHSDYSLATQDMLDLMAKKYDLLRPEVYTFTDVNDLLQNVDQWKGKEGVCVYSKNDQTIHKVKGAWYLALHHMKSELSNIEKVLDVWLEQGMPDYNTFYNYIFTTFDYELAEQVKSMISRIADGKKEVNKIVDGMNDFVNNRLLSLSTRKEQAQLVISSYGETGRSSMIFKMLDGKSLDKNDYKKLIFQILKN